MITDYQKEQAEIKKVNLALAKELAEHLGEGFQVDIACEGHWAAVLFPGVPQTQEGRFNGPGYSVHTRDRDKWTVTVIWPGNRWPNDKDSYSINVSKRRGVEVLAKEINRRLAGYPVAWKEQKAKLDQETTDADNQRAALVELLAILDTEPRPNGQAGRANPGSHNVWAIDVNHNGTEVSLKTYHMSIGTMRKVLQVLAEEEEQPEYH